jgi:polar amino acid transport system substrate-binding protein
MTGSATKTTEREAFGIFSDPYVESKNVLFFKKGEAAKFKISGLADIVNYPTFKLGIVRGFEYGDDYTKALNDPKVGKKFKAMLDEAGNENQQLQKIVAGRINAGIHNQFVGTAAAKALKLYDQLETSPATISADINHWLMSKKTVSPEFVKEFNTVLAKVKADGSYQKILSKYLN